ncbi:MAG TPA: hypothetical protein ENJ22_02840 [Gammaproteobacteria bacterium]|nr:hypothetical protein [Gammaproteobacteria bacterium]
MSIPIKAKNVGSPDPELKTSPIMEGTDYSAEDLAQEAAELPVCYFNNIGYKHGTYVCSGSGELLRCDKGIWVQVGSCDPDNP